MNDGTERRLSVVCGAPNVTAGKKYPFARVGATVPHGKGGAPMKLEKAKLREKSPRACSAARGSWDWARSMTASSSWPPTPRRVRRSWKPCRSPTTASSWT